MLGFAGSAQECPTCGFGCNSVPVEADPSLASQDAGATTETRPTATRPGWEVQMNRVGDTDT